MSESLHDHFSDAGFQRDVELLPYSYWKIGGPADLFIEPSSVSAAVEAIRLCIDTEMRFVVIGQGTNVLFDDKGYRGAVIRIGNSLSKIEWIGDGLLYAESGVWVPFLSVNVAKAGYSGFEHTVGIPASLGGLVYMNGGSLRNNLDKNIHSVKVIDPDGHVIDLRNDDCDFDYRHSRFQKTGEIILSANLTFECRAAYAEMRAQMLEILRARRLKFPRKHPNCGSVFKSSPSLYERYGPPGKIIEELGFKGLRSGALEVSQIHANFIVNKGKGSSADVLQIVGKINDAVFALAGERMTPEFRYLHPEKGFMEAQEYLASSGEC